MSDSTSPLTPGDPLRSGTAAAQQAPPQQDPPPEDPRPQDPPPGPRRLTRSREDRVLAGVAGGLGRYFGVDPIVFRIGFAVATLAGGAGVLAYLAALLFVPAEGSTQGAERSTGAIVGAALLAVVAFVVLAPTLPLLIPLAVLAAIGVLVWRALTGSDASAGRVVGLIALVMIGLLAAGVAAVGVAFAAAIGGGWVIASLVVLAGLLLTGAAFVGGARWLIVPALVLAIPLAVVAAADLDVDGGIGEREFRPVSRDDLRGGYDLGLGKMTVDLRDMDLPPGTTEVDLELGMGEALVLVPRDACVSASAEVGAGYVNVLGRENGGLDLDVADRRSPAAGSPGLAIGAHIGAGALNVRYSDVGFDFDGFGRDFGRDRFGDSAFVEQTACA